VVWPPRFFCTSLPKGQRLSYNRAIRYTPGRGRGQKQGVS